MDMMWYRRRGLMVAPHIESVSGSIASFNSDYNKIRVKSLICDIEPIQGGTGSPSPENVRPISGHTTTSIYLAGKDILPDITMVGGFYSENGTPSPSNATKRSATFIPVKDGDIFSLRFILPSNTGSRLRVHEYDENYEWLRQVYVTQPLLGGRNIFTVPISNDAKYVRFSLPNYNTLNVFTNSSNISFDFGQTIYGATLNAVSGKLLITHKRIVLNGSEDWTRVTGTYNYCRLQINDSLVSNYGICDRFSRVTITSTSNNQGFNTYYSSSANAYYIGIRYDDIFSGGDTDSLKNWLSQNNTTVIYKVLEPTEIQLTSQDIHTLLGENNIWSDSTDVSVDYWKWGK